MGKSSIKFAAIGECMIELRHQNAHTLTMGFAGDTLNVALYLARYQQEVGAEVHYVTALGDDPYSGMMLENWQQESIHCEFVQILPGQLPGLYFIRTDEQGERRFYYYRSQSAARQLFYSPRIESVCKQLFEFSYLYLSGISLAILDKASQQKLLHFLHQAREKGVIICFDTNYRPRLWKNITTAREVIEQTLRVVNVALPTLSDEQELFGDKTSEAVAEHLHRLGVQEVVVKNGEKGCLVSNQLHQEQVPAQRAERVVDTTAAGDSFNAGYLAGRMKGLDLADAARWGHQLAAAVVGYPGAIIPQQAMPKL